MAISLKDPEADRLAREVAARTGETLTAAVIVALRERLARLKGQSPPPAVARRASRHRPTLRRVADARRPASRRDSGYDEQGLPR